MSINPVDLAAAAEGILNPSTCSSANGCCRPRPRPAACCSKSPDAMKAMPEVLRLLGEAAQVDRTALAFAEIGPNGEKWLKIKAEWISEIAADATATASATAWPGTNRAPISSARCCRPARAWCSAPRPCRAIEGVSITSDKARTSAIVPILVDGEYVGVIGFDDWQRVREFDSSIVSALEIAAGLVGAALHRERLVETVRRRTRARRRRAAVVSWPRQRAAARRISCKPGARSRPAGLRQQHPARRHRQMDAAAAYAIGFDPAANHWRCFVHVENGKAGAAALPGHGHAGRNPHRARCSSSSRNRCSTSCEPLDRLLWPGVADWHAREGHKSAYLLPLVFGEQHRRAASAWCSARTKR